MKKAKNMNTPHTHACNCHTHAPTGEAHSLGAYAWPLVSLLLLGGGLLLDAAGAFGHPLLRLAWYLGAYLPVGLPVLRSAWEQLRRGGLFNEFTLMTLAAIGAFCIGEYPEGVAVMLFYTVGEIFQERAVGRARRSIGALLDVRPRTANLVGGERTEAIAPERVAVGSEIEIRAGERVPLDGVLLDAEASFNTSALTGESVPRRIRRGENVLAGMIAENRTVRVRTTRPFADSALARILRLVEQAADRKAPAERFIRRFARIYTPVVTLLAAVIATAPWLWSLVDPQFAFSWSESIYRGLVFLVISCPCALVVSIPLGYFGGIGAASRQGILFKGGNFLDVVTRLGTVLFDKTGTLTEGTFEVREVHTAPEVSERKLLETLAALESRSTHPIARAVVRYAENRGVAVARGADTTEHPGRGVSGRLAQGEALAGNTRLLRERGVEYPAELDASAETSVLAALDDRYLGCVTVADRPKPDAREAVEALKAEGIPHIGILSGDRQAVVSRLAGQLGIDEAWGDLLPEGKAARIEAKRSESSLPVAFVGDGINDAPALALSDLGIAMGGLGSDAAIETADVVIQSDRPSKVATAIRIGRATRRIVWQNIALAFGVKLLVLVLGAGGLATLWEAVFADVGVALLAILNAVRIQRKQF